LALNFKSSADLQIGRICSCAKSLWRYDIDVQGYFEHGNGALQ
jgi:hypothetical protein